ncbi:MAG TPA: ABC transporter permease subunit [Thermomicrobiales bacterium]|nr:ABC transporter permease subunit [Thermomicrobiales bacterium]
MIHALQSELFRLRRRPQTWIMPILAVAFIGMFYGVLFLVYQFGPTSDRPEMQESVMVANIFENGMQMFGFFGGILTVIVASSLIGSEFSWNTLRPLVARASSRSSLLSAKWIVVALYTVFMVIVGIAGSMVLASVTSLLMDTSISLPSGTWDEFAIGLVRWIVAMLPGSAIAFAAALLTRSNAAGIAIGIGISFVEPLIFGLLSIVADVFDTVQEYGIAWNVAQLINISTQSDGGFQDPVDAAQVWQSTGILAVYVVIFVAATYYVFRRRDITSG